MTDMTKGAEANYPLESVTILEMSEPPAHSSFSRDLTFRDQPNAAKIGGSSKALTCGNGSLRDSRLSGIEITPVCESS